MSTENIKGHTLQGKIIKQLLEEKLAKMNIVQVCNDYGITDIEEEKEVPKNV